MNFPHTATISRSIKTGTKYNYADDGTVKCFLQPIDSEEVELYGATFGKASICYLPSTSDVSESDRLVIGGITYGVKGVRHHNYGNLKHKRAIVEAL
jgi:hypothetical protein